LTDANIPFDETHLIENVQIENLSIHGRQITNAQEGQFTVNAFVQGLEMI
jgi:hypothetical protein